MTAEAMLAREVVHQGGRMIREAFGRGGFTFKGRQDYLTETDGAVERAVRAAILARFPDHAVLGEEEGGDASAAHLWILDPIDGTANFARHIPHCCISLAYLHEGRPVVAAIYDPLHEELFFAERGQGPRLALDGDILPSGRIPIATRGGLKARGHPVGATGMYQIIEVVQQLRGEAHGSQVEDARIGMAQNIGGSGSNIITHILKVV